MHILGGGANTPPPLHIFVRPNVNIYIIDWVTLPIIFIKFCGRLGKFFCSDS